MEGLTDAQNRVVMHEEGAMFVRTSAQGVGGVLARRVAELLDSSKGKHYKILFIVPMNLMITRLEELIEGWVGNEKRRVEITTFHGFCEDVLKRYGSYIDLPRNFGFIDNQKEYIRLLLEGIQKDDPNRFLTEQEAHQLYQGILYVKNNANSDEKQDFIREHFLEYGEFQKDMDRYQTVLKERNLYDESDLVRLTCKLFKECPFITKDYRKAFRHLMVLDAAHMSSVQFELIKVFCDDPNYKNVLITSDDSKMAERFDPHAIQLKELVSFMERKVAEKVELRLNSYNYIEVSDLMGIFTKKDDAEIDVKNVSFGKWQSQQPPHLTVYERFHDEIEAVSSLATSYGNCNETVCIMANESTVQAFEAYFDREKGELGKGLSYYFTGFNKPFRSKVAQTLISILHVLLNEEDVGSIRKMCEHLDIWMPELFIIPRDEETSLLQLVIQVNSSKIPEVTGLLNLLRQKRDRYEQFVEQFWELPKVLSKEIVDVGDGDVSELNRLREVFEEYNLENAQENKTLTGVLEYVKGVYQQYKIAILTEHFVPVREKYDYVFLTSYTKPRSAWEMETSLKQLSLALGLAKNRVFISYSKSEQ